MYRTVLFTISLFCLATLCTHFSLVLSTAAQTCGGQGVVVQVLGSGGPELQDKRASSSYLVWQDGESRVLVDAGGGSALRFGESGANMSQLDVILFTHFHVDHSSDFPALMFSSWFGERARPLPVYGPAIALRLRCKNEGPLSDLNANDTLVRPCHKKAGPWLSHQR